MSLLILILLNIQTFRGSLTILVSTELNSLWFSSLLQTQRFYFQSYGCWELIFSGETVELGVYENAKLVFPFF